jgi:hydroxyacyl-ACP dehydratase HTD2-like protein with hotdog domain
MSLDATAVKEGDELPVLHLQPSLGQVIRYCALQWTFPAFFYDPEAARAAGMPGTIVPGPLKVGLLYRAVDEWLGSAGWIRQVRAAHRRPDRTNRPIDIAGRVARVYEEDGKRRADLELAIINEEGQPSVRGFAVVEFH